MTEAKEKQQTAFENGWTVSFDEVCFIDVIVHNNSLQNVCVRGHIDAKSVTCCSVSPDTLTDMMSCLPLLFFTENPTTDQ